VLHHLQPVLPGDLQDGGHVAGHTQQVDADDGLGLGGDLPADVLGGDGPGVPVDVAPDDLGAGLAEGDGGGAEGVGGDDDLVAGPDAAQGGGQAQGVGGVVHGEGVF